MGKLKAEQLKLGRWNICNERGETVNWEACNHSVQNRLDSRLLSKTVNTRIANTNL